VFFEFQKIPFNLSNSCQLRSPDVSLMKLMIDSELIIRDGLRVEGDDK
jgi:hypothetical protein